MAAVLGKQEPFYLLDIFVVWSGFGALVFISIFVVFCLRYDSCRTVSKGTVDFGLWLS